MDEVNDSEYMVPAFEAISDLLSTSAEELEGIVSECEKVTQDFPSPTIYQ